MNIFQSVLGARVIFVLGVINFILLLLLYFSCRCAMTSKVLGLMKYKRYQRFAKLHCYFWYGLVASVIIHVIFAVSMLGIPF